MLVDPARVLRLLVVFLACTAPLVASAALPGLAQAAKHRDIFVSDPSSTPCPPAGTVWTATAGTPNNATLSTLMKTFVCSLKKYSLMNMLCTIFKINYTTPNNTFVLLKSLIDPDGVRAREVSAREVEITLMDLGDYSGSGTGVGYILGLSPNIDSLDSEALSNSASESENAIGPVVWECEGDGESGRVLGITYQ